MESQHMDTMSNCRLDSSGHSIGNIMEFDIQKDFFSLFLDGLEKGRSLCCEKLESDLKDFCPLKFLDERQSIIFRRNVQSDNDSVRYRYLHGYPLFSESIILLSFFAVLPR